MRSAKLSLVQFQSILYDLDKNIEKAISYIDKAKEKHADLVIFPELFLSGYNPDMVSQQYFDYAININENSRLLSTFKNKAKENSINLIVPLSTYKALPGVIYNSAIVIDRNGEVIGCYDKTHLWAGERNHFRHGDDYPVFDLDIGRVGIMICYDGGFPEVSRNLALAGAELILCPSAFPIQDKDMWDIYFKARALENTCFTIGVNRVGEEGSIHLFGNNKVVNPRGEVLLDAPIDAEDMQLVEVDLNSIKKYRKDIPFLRDRKIAYSL
ncbi:nitrilase-related carbon-nitrogen hydrolase [Aquibacillus albus]|uniref:Amidohydrolase n=1 Tax=Aquibacillus albus TaxID=1168171 RepID=A0ABS2N5P2_9BACI|nr:nitrilase-related carbon-nitrogen hydrolase [Aquibacillus albus]MBM7573447.1 putative amidohydrolase [Aquibacillus albus]